jgi:hypothetical protein
MARESDMDLGERFEIGSVKHHEPRLTNHASLRIELIAKQLHFLATWHSALAIAF